MKSFAVILSALVAAVAAKPHILNTTFDVKRGQGFTIKFDGCESGCTIDLEDGPANALTKLKTLTSNASGGSATVTVDDIPTGLYAFKIVDNSSGEINYSVQFQFTGTAASSTSSSSAATSSTSTTSTKSSTSTSTTTTTTTESSTTATSSSTTTATPTMSTTTTASNSDNTASPSSPPDSGSDRLSSPIALLAGVLAAMAYLN